MTSRLLTLVWLLLPLWAGAGTTNVYVATDGNDTAGAGTLLAPFKTIQKAVNWLAGSELGPGPGIYTEQKNIWLRGGTYTNVTARIQSWYTSNLQLAAYDPTNEPVTLAGGIYVNGWTDAGGGWWTNALPEFPAMTVANVNQVADWQPRMLVMSNATVNRTVEPATGKYYYTSLSGTALVYTNDSLTSSANGEVQIDGSWEDSELAIASNVGATKTITLGAAWVNDRSADVVASYRLFNTPAGDTNQTICFWWDKTNDVIWIKAPTQPSTDSVLVPTTTRLLRFDGQAGIYTTNICISNLTFACATCTIGQGTKDDAGSIYVPMLDFTLGTDCVVSDCTFYGTAGTAVGNDNWLTCTNITVKNCVIHDVGVSGIAFPKTHGVIVTNCLIYNFGRMCQAATGITTSRESTVQNCTITNGPGKGIRAIWDGGGAAASWLTGITVRDNWVSHVAKELRDNGAIYWGLSTGCMVYHNYVGDVYSAYTNFANWQADNKTTNWNHHLAFYSDFTNTAIAYISNITFNCDQPFELHITTNAAFINNVFINKRNVTNQVLFANSKIQGHQFTNNIWYVVSAPQINVEDASYVPFEVSHELAVSNWTGNIIYSSLGYNGDNPTNITSADPLFTLVPSTAPGCLGEMTLTFGGASPAPGLGINALSLAGIGYNGGLTNCSTPAAPTAVHIIRGATLRGVTFQ